MRGDGPRKEYLQEKGKKLGEKPISETTHLSGDDWAFIVTRVCGICNCSVRIQWAVAKKERVQVEGGEGGVRRMKKHDTIWADTWSVVNRGKKKEVFGKNF